ncbi:CsbD family protein [Bradyrhizobium sp. CB82]|uniref:CsbD family protein n=1 Tax=Bradyrhizobium sp. CB82 TaxID=3039159 RepID=UPI0024B08065|nr:CsbD family protein [Bradyrhizobium sp. CB82]WFU39349.1 CsbD family protein [Bradyrhizobium sp. CB82]
MGSTSDKIKGATNETVGKAKQGIGAATGSERMKGEGTVQEVKGKGQQAMGDAKDAAKEAIDRAAANAKRTAE